MGRLPPVAKGQLRSCCICGFWYPERDSRIIEKDGKWYCRQDLDTLTEAERASALKGRL